MAAFKDKKNGSWYVQFRYTDWRGERQQKLKRGFATKKDAQAWEREFLMQKQADVAKMRLSLPSAVYHRLTPALRAALAVENCRRGNVVPIFNLFFRGIVK